MQIVYSTLILSQNLRNKNRKRRCHSSESYPSAYLYEKKWNVSNIFKTLKIKQYINTNYILATKFLDWYLTRYKLFSFTSRSILDGMISTRAYWHFMNISARGNSFIWFQHCKDVTNELPGFSIKKILYSSNVHIWHIFKI